MLAPINNHPKSTFASFGFSSVNNNDKRFFAAPKRKPLTKLEKTVTALGSTLGTLLPLLLISSYQKKPFHKIKYAEKEMIILSTGSISGGILGGIMSEKNADVKRKVHEGIFQFFNAVIPTLLIQPMLKACDMFKIKNNKAKAGILIGGIFSGMQLGAMISNKLNGKSNSRDKRNVKFIDTLANIDVLSGALIMAKFPLLDKLKVERFLPFVYQWTGYQSGKIQ